MLTEGGASTLSTVTFRLPVVVVVRLLSVARAAIVCAAPSSPPGVFQVYS